MQTVNRSAIVTYSTAQMYALVVDVPKYPEFLHWCAAASVDAEELDQAVASIEISFKGIRQVFSTRNTMRKNESIVMHLVQGPFSYLEGEWSFTELGESASKIALVLSFDFSVTSLSRLVGPVFAGIVDSQIDAFQVRAQQVYG